MITREQVEDIFSRTRFLPVPKEVLIFSDSAIATPTGQLALAATKPFGADRIILTQISDETSPVHEAIHRFGILNERLTARLTSIATPLILRRRPIRTVKYKECTAGHPGCINEKTALQEAGVKSVLGEGFPTVRHLILIE